ncbi:phage tail protein [Photobacterium kasasachensis]|uniref:phage tail protein n=1 Tax=Photobacterium kasasachensis TaxID=2910240 RepID=UPI003D11FAAC
MAEPYVGQITMVAYNFAPRGWAQCDGAILPINQYPMLFAIIGDQYGGDGTTTFALPDMRGRVPLHRGTLANQWHYSMGEKGGIENVVLSPAELPEHNHALMASQDNADAYGAVGSPLLGTQTVATGETLVPIYNWGTEPLVAMASDAISSAGGNQAHNNMQPVQVINFIIALEGLFPPRN